MKNALYALLMGLCLTACNETGSKEEALSQAPSDVAPVSPTNPTLAPENPVAVAPAPVASTPEDCSSLTGIVGNWVSVNTATGVQDPSNTIVVRNDCTVSHKSCDVELKLPLPSVKTASTYYWIANRAAYAQGLTATNGQTECVSQTRPIFQWSPQAGYTQISYSDRVGNFVRVP